MKDNRQKNLRPISKKAYKDFTDRFADTFNGSHSNLKAYTDAVTMLDNYLDGMTLERVCADVAPEAVIAFLMIRPEIDKAMQRSLNARRRAQLRRQADTPKSPHVIPSSDLSLPNPTPAAATPEGTTINENLTKAPIIVSPRFHRPLNRSERRELERQQRKLSKKTMTGKTVMPVPPVML